MKDVLHQPVITEKSTQLQEQGRYAFKVAFRANKQQIKAAVEERYPEVKVSKVNTMIMPSKPKGRYTPEGFVEGRASVWKKAIVSLKEGEIDFFEEI